VKKLAVAALVSPPLHMASIAQANAKAEQLVQRDGAVPPVIGCHRGGAHAGWPYPYPQHRQPSLNLA
jgi:hypothetical protein